MAYNPYQYPYQNMFQQFQQPIQPISQPITQQMNQPISQPQQMQNGGFIPVASEEEALKWAVAPGNLMTFKVMGKPIVIEKSMGFSQLEEPKIERYRLVKEDAVIEEPSDEKSELEEMKADIEDLKGEIEDIKTKLRERVRSSRRKEEPKKEEPADE